MSGIDQFFATLPPWLGSVPQLLSASGILGILYVLVRYRLGALEVDVKTKQVTIEGDKIDAEIDIKLREHFSGELTRLAETVAQAARDVEEAKERQRQCEEREERLRKRVRKLEDDLAGIVRAIAVEGSLRILDATDQPSDDVVQAAIRALENIIERRNNERNGEKP